MGTLAAIGNPVILFDGVCNLCNRSVQFVIKHDTRNVFRFAALQSPYGRAHLPKFNIHPDSLETIVLIAGNRCYQRSEAVLQVAKFLGGWWTMLYAFKIIPAFIRDWGYRVVANNRYTWFGRQDQCMIPTPELKIRFLD